MDSMETIDTKDDRHWVDVPGWPRAHIFSDRGFRLLVLTDDLTTGLTGYGPIWLVVCPHCRINIFAVQANEIRRKFKSGKMPGCGCTNPGHENFRGDHRKHFG